MLPRKLYFPSDQEDLVPSYWLPSPLFQSFRNCFMDHVKQPFGMTYVYSGPRRTGKTTACGAAILKLYLHACGRDAPCLYIDAGTSCRGGFREALAVPDTVSDSDIVNMLCNILGPADTTKAPVGCPPVFFVDNIVQLGNDDKDFINKLYKKCYRKRIMVFLLTEEDRTANVLCGMNGGERIKPLAGMYETAEEPDEKQPGWKIVTDESDQKIASGIIWKQQEWDLKHLSALVRRHYPDFQWDEYNTAGLTNGELTFIQEGDLPDTAISAAAEIMESSLDGEDAVLSAFKDSSFNDIFEAQPPPG